MFVNNTNYFLMKDNKTSSLKKRLSQYGTLAVALSGVAEANGQVIYTDEDPDFLGEIGSEFVIDLNNDGISDVTLMGMGVQNSYSSFASVIADIDEDNVKLIGTSDEAAALDSDVVISMGTPGGFISNSGDPIKLGGFYSYFSTSYTSSSGLWLGATDKFIGIQFKSDIGDTHYGWIRLDVNETATGFTVKDYAYNATPDAAINTGQMDGVSVEDLSKKDKITIINTPTVLKVKNENSAPIDFQLVSMTGQIIDSGRIHTETREISMNASTGIYVLRIGDDTQTILTKTILK